MSFNQSVWQYQYDGISLCQSSVCEIKIFSHLCNLITYFLIAQFNFVGKLLGPRGNTLKRLQAQTGTKMSVLGKGSMRDKEKVCTFSFTRFFL